MDPPNIYLISGFQTVVWGPTTVLDCDVEGPQQKGEYSGLSFSIAHLLEVGEKMCWCFYWLEWSWLAEEFIIFKHKTNTQRWFLMTKSSHIGGLWSNLHIMRVLDMKKFGNPCIRPYIFIAMHPLFILSDFSNKCSHFALNWNENLNLKIPLKFWKYSFQSCLRLE